MSKLLNQVAIITGAASGIGRAAAKLFAAEGASVIIADVQDEAGEMVAAEIRTAHGRALFQHTDVTDESQVQELIERTITEYGGLHILYNNAGYEFLSEVHELASLDWQRQIDINLTGTFYSCKYALQHFLESGGGVILNTASISAFLPSPKRPAYNAAKSGVIMLTKNIAAQYGHKGIRANVICPGITLTAMTAAMRDSAEIMQRACRCAVLNRVASPEEIARPALFLVSEDASFITGTTLLVDGGMNLGGFWEHDS